jgi:hypothetical protein
MSGFQVAVWESFTAPSEPTAMNLLTIQSDHPVSANRPELVTRPAIRHGTGNMPTEGINVTRTGRLGNRGLHVPITGTRRERLCCVIHLAFPSGPTQGLFQKPPVETNFPANHPSIH